VHVRLLAPVRRAVVRRPDQSPSRTESGAAGSEINCSPPCRTQPFSALPHDEGIVIARPRGNSAEIRRPGTYTAAHGPLSIRVLTGGARRPIPVTNQAGQELRDESNILGHGPRQVERYVARGVNPYLPDPQKDRGR
jgi:hypothetical protein